MRRKNRTEKIPFREEREEKTGYLVNSRPVGHALKKKKTIKYIKKHKG